MTHLDDVSVEELQAALSEAEGRKPTQRLITAIAYKHGVTQTELAEWYGVQRRTIYNWLTRFDGRPVAEAIHDADRPGRPRKLAPDEREALFEALHEPPSAVGLDGVGERNRWHPELVRGFVDEEFGVTYSVASCRRLLDEAREARQ